MSHHRESHVTPCMRHMPKARADTLLDLLQREEPIDVDLIKCHNSLANSNVARNA